MVYIIMQVDCNCVDRCGDTPIRIEKLGYEVTEEDAIQACETLEKNKKHGYTCGEGSYPYWTYECILPRTEGKELRLLREKLSRLMDGLPPDKVVWVTPSGSYTAKDMIKNISVCNKTGRQYADELLRVARDLLSKEVK